MYIYIRFYIYVYMYICVNKYVQTYIGLIQQESTSLRKEKHPHSRPNSSTVTEDKGLYSSATGTSGIREASVTSTVTAPTASLPGVSQSSSRASTAAVNPINNPTNNRRINAENDGVRKAVIERQGEGKESREKEESVENGRDQSVLRRAGSERHKEKEKDKEGRSQSRGRDGKGILPRKAAVPSFSAARLEQASLQLAIQQQQEQRDLEELERADRAAEEKMQILLREKENRKAEEEMQTLLRAQSLKVQQQKQQQREFEELERKNREAEEYKQTLLRESDSRKAEEQRSLYTQSKVAVKGSWKYGASIAVGAGIGIYICI
jgi:hypothetical protein